MKFDTKTKEFIKWEEKNYFPSEPIFVANPNSSGSEDEGQSSYQFIIHN